jgi:hypothetical protein
MMKMSEKDPLKLTLSEWHAQEWRAVQPYGTWFMASLIGGVVLKALDFWLDLPHIISMGIGIPLCFFMFYNAGKAGEIRKRRDAEQKEAIEQRWKQEDEQLYQQRQ